MISSIHPAKPLPWQDRSECRQEQRSESLRSPACRETLIVSRSLPGESSQITIVVPEGVSARADVLVRARLPTLSRRQVRELFAAGRIRINGHFARKGSKADAGNTLTVDLPEEERTAHPAPDATLTIEVLFEDPDLVALDKPGGIPTLPLRVGERGTLANFLATRYPDSATVGGSLEAGLVHRLDTGTSGVILAARGAEAYRHLRDQFRKGEIGKSYIALVWGDLNSSGRIESSIAHAAPDARRMEAHCSKDSAVRSRARPAVTRFRPVKRYAGVTLIAVRILTGVRHQIRVHLASIGHPIVGDDLYATRTLQPPHAQWTNRPFLHARSLSFTHPKQGRRVRIVAPIPADMRATLNRLEESSAPSS